MSNYIQTKAQNKEDLKQLSFLFDKIFAPEKVGQLANTLTRYFPNLNYNNWYISKTNIDDEIVSGFVKIPWTWLFNGIELKVAELGIAGTEETHRGKGLFKHNHQLFNDDLLENSYDLAVIQGIPGIYHRLGYYYALPMEHHTELPLTSLPSNCNSKIRSANENDIDFLLEEDKYYHRKHAISAVRTKDHWHYILDKGQTTDYATKIYILEDETDKYYVRILEAGFGQGLIVSEASDNCSSDQLNELLAFLNQEAVHLKKPYIRLNLPNSHSLVKKAMLHGATTRPSYGWQIKIIDIKSLINKLKPVFDQRIKYSEFAGLNATITLDFYQSQVHLALINGKLNVVDEEAKHTDYHMSIPEDLLPLIILGHRSWQELQFVRPDLFPADQFLRMDAHHPSELTGELMSVLFPKLDNWIYCEY
ncbi:GNAT family N-acetyltransferase [Carboxylicivirga sp. M1479]|uniref:GNAT family N-acetyltransferase n=1 Tax=Carboxylicivirga sp. M1479 TaxID=2594476 RepID=UPI0011777468|nr:GNAT family N-acetyltransferase [Carboxylicivirga sp. M1479]TRX70404.1 GNAT family N-acetyltransferase [Carboxylicivirga sp. M1479]